MSNTQNATPTQEMIDAENARHDEMAAACAIDSDNYAKFVANLTSQPETYNLSSPVISALVAGLDRLAPASLELDHLKRVLTYGEKMRINAPIIDFPAGQDILSARQAQQEGKELSKRQRNRLLLAHALLGKITEAMELAPILTEILLGEDFDPVNLVEELGDDAFYTSLALQAIGGNPEQVVYTNVRKLAKRYKGGAFTREEAVNRDLNVERKSLEEAALGKAN